MGAGRAVISAMTLSEIRAVLAARGLRPLKQLGQNFLHDQNLAAWLADRVLDGSPANAEVVEIGPGLGALTGTLLDQGARVVALEKDRGLCAALRERFAPELAAGRLDLRHGDALKLLPALEPAVLCGNLPYYISTPLLMEGLRLDAGRMLFVMQKEVGQRLASGAGGKIYGALTVLVQVAYEVELLRTLPGSVFFPPPEVASVAVRLRRKDEPLVTAPERAAFAAFVQRGFSQRRKKLSNLLPVDDERRAEHLTPPEWVALWRGAAGGNERPTS
jgi:16S rRNA (adenine1518-N6/adenine1519-N6)-dimethyltransferase